MYYHHSDPLSHALFGVALGGYFFIRGLRAWLEKRAIQNKPLSKIKSIAMGEAEIAGTVKAEALVKAPFSNQDCVYCKYTVEEPNKNGWREVDHGAEFSIFYVNDGTGQILMNPEGAEFYGAQTFQTITENSQGLFEPGIGEWVRKRQEKSMLGSFGLGSHYRFTEYVIAPEQIVFVEGSVMKVRHVVGGKEREENIITKRESGHFILSAYSEERLLTQLAWKAPLQVVGGAALLLSCLWYLVERFQLERYL